MLKRLTRVKKGKRKKKAKKAWKVKKAMASDGDVLLVSFSD